MIATDQAHERFHALGVVILGDVGDEAAVADGQQEPEASVQNGTGRPVPVHELDLIVHGPLHHAPGIEAEQDVVEALVHHLDAHAQRLFAIGRAREGQFRFLEIESVFDVIGAAGQHFVQLTRGISSNATGHDQGNV